MKRKIIILSAFITPFRSGAEACAEEVSALLKDRYDITIVTARLRRDLPHMDRLESGVRVWRVGIGSSIDKWLFPFLAPRAAKALKPDIIHAVLETFAGLALMFCGRGARRILTLQTTNRSFLKGPIVRSPDSVTAISTALINIAEGLGRKDVTLIPNGVRLAEIQAASAAHKKIEGRILFVGRLEQVKGVDTLLYAFLGINHAHLRIVGEGSQRSALEALARNLNIADRVTFVGRVSPAHVAVEYAQAQIFCGLSRSEALGNVFLEAQAAGCAVVGTNVGGIPDIVHHGETGLLVSPNDMEAAQDALERLLHFEELRTVISTGGKKNAAAYDWKAIAERYAAIYDLPSA